jgi:hypothetical protein
MKNKTENGEVNVRTSNEIELEEGYSTRMSINQNDQENVEDSTNQTDNNVHREDFKIEKTQPTRLLNLNIKDIKNFKPLDLLDLKGLTDIFNSYATKKTYATGFFNIALVATNFAQMKQFITKDIWNAINIVIMTFIGLSLILQFLVAILLVFLAKQGEFIDENKRNQLIRSNNGASILVLIISVINIFINVFISV